MEILKTFILILSFIWLYLEWKKWQAEKKNEKFSERLIGIMLIIEIIIVSYSLIIQMITW